MELKPKIRRRRVTLYPRKLHVPVPLEFYRAVERESKRNGVGLAAVARECLLSGWPLVRDRNRKRRRALERKEAP